VIAIDSADRTPPSEQVRRQLADQILSGVLVDGVRLPSVRQLANDLGLAAGTVARAYAALETDGFVRTARGAGTRVRRSAEHNAALIDAALDYVEAARASGASLDQAAAALRAAWQPEGSSVDTRSADVSTLEHVTAADA
jgi:GntR family transcriptional regulator